MLPKDGFRNIIALASDGTVEVLEAVPAEQWDAFADTHIDLIAIIEVLDEGEERNAAMAEHPTGGVDTDHNVILFPAHRHPPDVDVFDQDPDTA